MLFKQKLSIILFLSLVLAISGCKGFELGTTSESGAPLPGEKISRGDLASYGFKLGPRGVLLEKTSEVYVIPPGEFGIVKGDEGYPYGYVKSSDYSDDANGVFIPQRKVTISPYTIGQYEVTRELYEAVLDGEKLGGFNLVSDPQNGTTSLYPLTPIFGISWYDALYFCNLLTEKTIGADQKVYTLEDIELMYSGTTSDGKKRYRIYKIGKIEMDITKKGYRLPTEAEWEFAARGGSPGNYDWTFLYSGSSKDQGLGDVTILEIMLNRELVFSTYGVGWYNHNIAPFYHIGRSFLVQNVGAWENGSNAINTYDMSGNVSEMCWDIYDTIVKENVQNPIGPQLSGRVTPSKRVIRGGCINSTSIACTVCYRQCIESSSVNNQYVGFRLARSLGDDE